MRVADDDQWRDMNTGINGYLMKLIWPSVAFEYRLDWEERQVTGQTYVFDKIVLVDRSGGSRGDSVGGPKKVRPWALACRAPTLAHSLSSLSPPPSGISSPSMFSYLHLFPFPFPTC